MMERKDGTLRFDYERQIWVRWNGSAWISEGVGTSRDRWPAGSTVPYAER